MIKDLLGIIVTVNVNVIKNVTLTNIVNAEKKIVDKLVDECTETIEEVKLAKITPTELHSAENENKYGSCKVYIVLMIVVFTIFTGITIYFVYYNWSLIKNNVSCIKFNTHKETKI